METARRITLIDSDSHLRAEISRLFLGLQYHVEPFEQGSELEGHWPTGGFILIHDTGKSVSEVAHDLPQAGVWLPIIAYGESPVPDRIVESMLAGAVDYWTLPFDEKTALRSLQRARERTERFGSTKMREADAARRIGCLSARELQVLAGVASGLQNREIAQQLGISARTVEVHRTHMMGKLKVKSTTDVMRIAFYASLPLQQGL